MALKQTISAMVPRTLVLKIKYLYQFFNRVKNKRKLIETDCEYSFISKKQALVFFGYYDVTPFNKESDEFLYLSLFEKDNYVRIFINNLHNNKETELGTSNAWNWQQGCRLRWMPNNSREIAFNDYNGSTYFMRIMNVDTKSERIIKYPLYDISPDGCLGLTVDFERLGVKRPGYGYTCRKYSDSERDLSSEYIGIVDLKTNTINTFLTYEEISKVAGNKSDGYKDNYINHLCFSPSGKQFLFFWLTARTGLHKADLLVYNIETNTIKLLEEEDIVSHYVWENEDSIICTAIDKNKKGHYYRYIVSTGKKQLLNPDNLNCDGHPSIYKEGLILTDTYPDLMGFQKLYLAGTDDNRFELLLSIYSHCCITGERRTDLHPRFNKDKNLIAFDANSKGKRNMCILKMQ